MKLGKNQLIVVVIVLVVVVGIGGYQYYSQQYAEKLKELQTLNVALNSEPRDLDPAIAYDVNSYDVHGNIFEQLVRYKRGTTEIEPSLAKSWEIIDKKTYVFELRNDVKFHDGTQFNASSVKFSLDRAIQMGAPPSLLLKDVIESVKVEGPYKVRITLKEEFAPFLSILSNSVASIVSQAAVEKYGKDFTKNPVGTGPFKFISWTTGEVNLTANEDYYLGSPRIKKVYYKTIVEATSRRVSLEQGQVDIVHRVPPGISPEDLDVVSKNPDIKVYGGVGLRTQFLGINTQKKPLNDTNVRKAIAIALDYETMVNKTMLGKAERITSPVPPSVWGSNLVIEPYQRNTTKAKELLSAAGYPKGFSTTLTYNIEDSVRRDLAILIRNNLKEIGIEVKIIGLDMPTALTEYYALNQELFLLGWRPDFVDPDNYLYPMLYSKNMPPNGSDWAGYIDPQLDEMIWKARIETDKSIRYTTYLKAQERTVDQVPYIYLYAPKGYTLARANVKGHVYDPLENLRIYPLYKE